MLNSNKKLVHQENTVGRLSCKTCEKWSTVFLITNKHVLTANHALNKHKKHFDSLFIEFVTVSHQKYSVNVIKQSVEDDVAILELNNEVKGIKPLYLDFNQVDYNEKWSTFGFPVKKYDFGERIYGSVSRPVRYFGHRTLPWDTELNCDYFDSNNGYSGLSGAPLIISGKYKGLILRQLRNSLGAVSTKKFRPLLSSLNIQYPLLQDIKNYLQGKSKKFVEVALIVGALFSSGYTNYFESPYIDKKILGVNVSDLGLPESIEINDSVFNNDKEYSRDELKSILKTANDLFLEKDFKKAKEMYFNIVNYLESKQKNNENIDLLKKSYNNLGACFNNQYDNNEALKYFRKAYNLDPNFIESIENIVISNLNTNNPENLKEANEKINMLLKKDSKNQGYIFNYLRYLIISNNYDELKKYLNELEELDIEKEEFLIIICHSFIYLNDYNKALELISKYEEKFPESYQIFILKAKLIFIINMYYENNTWYWTYVFPHSQNTEVKKAVIDLFDKAIDIIQKKNEESQLLEVLKEEREFYRLILEPKDFDKNFKIRILSKDLIDNVHIISEMLQVDSNIFKGEFDLAYSNLLKSNYFKVINYYDKKRLAAIFYNNFAPEYSLKILESIENEEIINKDPEYWNLLARNYSLLNQVDKLILIIEKSRNLFSESLNDYNFVLEFSLDTLSRFSTDEPSSSNQNALELFVKTASELVHLGITDKVRAIKAINDDGSLTSEFLDLITPKDNSLQDAINLIKEAYKKYNYSTYWLSQKLNIPYPEIFRIYDSDFYIHFNEQNEGDKKLISIFKDNNKYILDYSTLITLSKSNKLWLLKKYDKEFLVHHSLIKLIKKDLFNKESKELREILSFVDDNCKIINIELYEEKFKIQNELEVFDYWLEQSISIANKENYVFISDDLKLLKFLENNHLQGINTLSIIYHSLNNSLISNSEFISYLKKISESNLTFLPFNGNDLLEITILNELEINDNKNSILTRVLQDNMGNISLSLYNLINQIKFINSNNISFLYAIKDYFLVLWRENSIKFDSKIKYQYFITNYFIDLFEYYEKVTGIKDNKEIRTIEKFILTLWGIPLLECRMNEIDRLVQLSELISNKHQFKYKVLFNEITFLAKRRKVEFMNHLILAFKLYSI